MDFVRSRNEDGLLDPFREFEDLQEEINRLFDTTRAPGPKGIFERTYSPAMDVTETSGSYQILCDLPGMDMQDIEISIAGNVLTLKGEKKQGEMHEGSHLYREETSEGRFQRTLQLPLAVDADKAEAMLKNGVLSIMLPKREEVKTRQVSVKVS